MEEAWGEREVFSDVMEKMERMNRWKGFFGKAEVERKQHYTRELKILEKCSEQCTGNKLDLSEEQQGVVSSQDRSS